ncbi:MAG: M1 family aminopeptidase [Ferruginibacter sp.]
MISAFLTIAMLAITGMSQVFAQTAAVVKVGATDSPAININHIKLNLTLNWERRNVSGTAEIQFTMSKPTDEVLLDAADLTIHEIMSSGKRKLNFNYNSSLSSRNLLVKLNKLYQPGDTARVIISYNSNWVNESDPNNIWGSTGKGIRFFQPTHTEPNKRKQAWAHGEPVGNSYWFPCIEALPGLRTTELIMTTAKDIYVISNGVLEKTVENNDGTHRFYWRASKPYPNHLTSFIAGEYKNYRQDCQGTALNSFGYPDEYEAVKASTVRLADMCHYFSSATGVHYPHQSYSQVFVQDYPAHLGNHMVSTITENMIDDDRTHADFYYLWDITEAEALATQWFGNYVYCSRWNDVWLNKSFAHYFSHLYNEQKNGKDEFLLYLLSFDQGTYFGDWNSGIRHPVVQEKIEDTAAFVGDNYAVSRGTLVLHMLRKELGEENWWKAIRYYLTNYGGKAVTTREWQASVEAVAQKSYQWFFDQWVYRMGHPVFEVSKHYDAAKSEFQLTLKQVQVPDSNSKFPVAVFFSGSMNIKLDDRIETVWLDAKAENTFTFKLAAEPRLVSVDHESTWIKEISFSRNTEELLYAFLHNDDILARKDALLKLCNIAKDSSTNEATRKTIIEALRNVINSNSYWRFRANVLTQLQSVTNIAGNEKWSVQNDSATLQTVLSIINKENAWLKGNAIGVLGSTGNKKYTGIYLAALKDNSDRVINAAAIALGKTKDPLAFDALIGLIKKPSWKNQSLISALNGLKELGDKRGINTALRYMTDSRSPHWTLATPVWDHRLAATITLSELGGAEVGYPVLLKQFKQAIQDNDVNDIFFCTQQIATLGYEKGTEIFPILKEKFKADPNAMNAINNYEQLLQDSLKGK